jgi:type IV secretion system protein VirD4
MSQDEIAVMDGGKCILQLRGVRPFLSNKYDLAKHPNYAMTSDCDDRYVFNIERHLNRKLKLRENEIVEVYDCGYDDDASDDFDDYYDDCE